MKPKAALLPPEEVRLGVDIALYPTKHGQCMSSSAPDVLSLEEEAPTNCQMAMLMHMHQPAKPAGTAHGGSCRQGSEPSMRSCRRW